MLYKDIYGNVFVCPVCSMVLVRDGKFHPISEVEAEDVAELEAHKKNCSVLEMQCYDCAFKTPEERRGQYEFSIKTKTPDPAPREETPEQEEGAGGQG